MTLAYRAEYVKTLGKEEVPEVLLPQEWLARHIDSLPELRVVTSSGTWQLLPHCTERTNAPAATDDWAKVARRLGIELRVVSAGCCGMAGLYGHERDNRPTSDAIYRLSWSKRVSDPLQVGRLLATGYSCRCQASLSDGAHLLHPIQVLLSRLRREAQAGELEAPAPGQRRPVSALAEHHEEY